MRALRRLERLLLPDNRVGGELPSLKGMTRLIEVDVGHNRLSGVESTKDAPPTRARLPRLMHFVCHHNAFSFAPPPGAERVSLLHERTVLSTGKPGTRNAVPERTTVRYKVCAEKGCNENLGRQPLGLGRSKAELSCFIFLSPFPCISLTCRPYSYNNTSLVLTN